LAFQFKRGEAVPRAIRRIVGEQIAFSADRLRNAPLSDRDEAVHDARKSLKKIRAVIRLMSRELGPVAGAENTLFRDLARKLSALRDAAVLVETLDSLKDQLPEGTNLRLVAEVRTHLETERADITQGIAGPPVPAAVAFALERACERVRIWPLRATGFAALAPGLRRTFHRGRKALAFVRKNPTPELFHEWRKRVKDHWYHIRLLEGTWTEATRSCERTLKELETCLGDDHNLAVLRERVVAHENVPELAGLLVAVDNRQKLLRDRALRLGERLYATRPIDFVRQAEELWDSWQARREGARRRPAIQRKIRKARASVA
jgi:CHAD domain-containing protein